MNITEMLTRIQPPAELPPLHTVEPRPKCARCRDREVINNGDACELCRREMAQGYEILTMTGRRANGAQRDAGRLNHAVDIGSIKAKCGAQPGRRADWSPYHEEITTCPRCKKQLEKRKK